MLIRTQPEANALAAPSDVLQGTQTDDAVVSDDLSPPDAHSQIKWGSVTRVIAERPPRWEEMQRNVRTMDRDPTPHDVMIARVKEIGRHTRIELDSGRKAYFFVGDLLAVAFGCRYATQQFFGDVPELQAEYHMLSQGGVCGRVLSAPDRFSSPTVLEPIGYLADDNGAVVNLRDYGIVALPSVPRVPIIIVVGSSMDSGKTTMAANVIHGLTGAGCRVNAGKLTGTACVKDLNKMSDAGASAIRDFTHAGFASTAQASVAQLHDLCDVIITNLAADQPDYLVLEIADGVVQRETQLILDYLTNQGLVDHLCLAVHDALAAPTCVDLLRRQWDINVTAISGAATISPLSTDELRSLVSVPCLMAEDLDRPSVAELFHRSSETK